MRVVECDGYKWQWGDGIHDDHLGSDGHEANLEPCLRGLLGYDQVFLDVGAHVGHWTVRLASQARKVIAVEANPATALLLEENIRLNGITNAEVLNVAAWDSQAWLHLEDPNGRVRGGSTRTLPGGSADTPAVQLDVLLAAEPEIHLIKLDVEGADLHALRGLQVTLQRCRPVMFIERHDKYGYYDFDDLVALLTSLGYRYQPAPGGYMDAEYIVAHPV